MCHGSFSLFTLKKYGNWIHHLTCSYIFKLHNWACHIWPIPLGHCSLKKKTHQWHNTHKLLRKTWWKLSCWPKYLTCTKTRFDVTWWSTNCEHGFCVASGPLSETINILATSISFHIFPLPNHDMWHGRTLVFCCKVRSSPLRPIEEDFELPRWHERVSIQSASGVELLLLLT